MIFYLMYEEIITYKNDKSCHKMSKYKIKWRKRYVKRRNRRI
nr:MAG TPA: hypothetical protein [Bacteriophage sp.]